MKDLELVYTEEYVLLIDKRAEIEENHDHVFVGGFSEGESKILAYYPLTEKTKELNLPLLPNPFEEKVDIEKLACAKYNVKDGIRDYDERYYNTINVAKAEAFIEGYKAAQKSNKQYSLEDVEKAIELGFNLNKLDTNENLLKKQRDFIQSLSTQQLPKEFIPEYRYYYHSSKEFYSDAGFVECLKEQYESIKVEIPTCPLKAEIKTITNSEGKEELVGTYKY